MRILSKSLLTAAMVARVAVVTLAPASHAFALNGDVKLPPPYVSRALDAVLLPIDDQVRKAFKLSPKDTGVLVLSVEPNGVADKQNIMPGDVIAEIRGHKIAEPIDVDTVVYYWIKKGDDKFLIDYYRNGVIQNTTGIITLALFEVVIDMAAIATWEAWSVDTSFSYSEFYSEYSSEITESYSSSETTIEETASSEEFTSEITSEESSDAKDTDDDGTPDAADTDDDNDGTPDATDPDDNGDGADDSAEPPAADAPDGDGDNDGAPDATDDDDSTPDGDDGGADDGDAGDDSGDDGADDGGDDGADDGGDDSGGDDGGDE